MSDYSHFTNKQTTLEKLAEKKKNVKNAEKIYSTLTDEIKHEMELVKKKLSKKEEEQGSWIVRVGDAKAILKEVEAHDIHGNKISGDEYFVSVFTKFSTNYVQTIKRFKISKVKIAKGPYKGYSFYVYVPRQHIPDGIYTLKYELDQRKKPIDQHVPFPVRPPSDD